MRDNFPRLVMLLGVLGLTIVVACCSGCATLEDYAERHPVVVATAGVVVVAGVAIAAAHVRSSGAVVVRQCPNNQAVPSDCK